MSLTILAAIALGPVSARADSVNIVQNAGFESGFANWTSQGFFFASGDLGVGHTGVASVLTGCAGSYCLDPNIGAYIRQTLNTVPGQNYDLSFWVTENSGPTSGLAVYWGGNLIASVTNPASNMCQGNGCNWVQFTFTGLTAASSSTVLQLNGRQDPYSLYFDDISVTASETSAVPEPTSVALLGSGLLGAVGAIRRRFMVS